MIAKYDFSGSPIAYDASLRTPDNVALQTHVPLAFAFDPRSGQTIVAKVNTVSMDGSNGGGEIDIYTGFNGTTYHFDYPTQLSPPSYPTAPTSQYSYEGKTDFHVGLACGDTSFDYYNCAVAWVDKGIYNGAVMLQYFHVYANTVTFDPNGAWSPNDSSHVHEVNEKATFTPPALGFFDDKMWMSWKEFDGAIRVLRYSGNESHTRDGIFNFNPANMIVGPSFGHRDGSESAVIFNTTF